MQRQHCAVSNDKESIKSSDSDLDKDVLDVQQAVPMPNRVARALKTQARGFLACFAKPRVLQTKNIVSQEFKGTSKMYVPILPISKTQIMKEKKETLKVET